MRTTSSFDAQEAQAERGAGSISAGGDQFNRMSGSVLRVASGDGTLNDHLIEILMERSREHMDALTLHQHTIPGCWESKGQATGFDADRWSKTLHAAMSIEQRIKDISAIMDKHDPDKRIALYVDEWGAWHDPEPGTNPGFLYQQNTLRDALLAALSFNAFHRHTDRVKMTSIAQMVNVLQAMVLTDGSRMLLSPIRKRPGLARSALYAGDDRMKPTVQGMSE